MDEDFNGALLVSKTMYLLPPDKNAERIYEKVFQYCKGDWKLTLYILQKKYSYKVALYMLACMDNERKNFTLCRDCLILDEKDIYEKFFPGYLTYRRALRKTLRRGEDSLSATAINKMAITINKGDNVTIKEVTCECCKRPISQLKPYGKAGDPLGGDFNGMMLVPMKIYGFPLYKEAERIWEEILQQCQNDDKLAWYKLVLKYGKEVALYIYRIMTRTVTLSFIACAEIAQFWIMMSFARGFSQVLKQRRGFYWKTPMWKRLLNKIGLC